MIDRLGGALVSPRAELARVHAGGVGGVSDFLVLLLLQAVALYLPRLARAGWYTLDVSVLGGLLMALAIVARPVIVPIGLALVVGLLLRIACWRDSSGRHSDLGAVCLLPWLSLQICASLMGAFIPQLYRPEVRWAVHAVGGAWAVVLLVMAVRLVRAPRSASETSEAS